MEGLIFAPLRPRTMNVGMMQHLLTFLVDLGESDFDRLGAAVDIS